MNSIINKYYLFIILNLSIVLMQCDYDYGDINNDSFLDILDITEFINFIIDEDID